MRRPRRRNERIGCGTEARPVCARAIIPGRDRNSIQTAAAIAPNSVNRNRLRAKPSDALRRSLAMRIEMATPTAKPKMPDRTLAVTDRRTPRIRPTKMPARIANANAGMSSQRSPPSRSKTDSASGVIEERSAREPARASHELLDVELAVRETRAEHLLVELPDAGLRDLRDERPPLGKLPARDPLLEEGAEILCAHGRFFAQHHARERSLLPLRVGHRDDGSLR